MFVHENEKSYLPTLSQSFLSARKRHKGKQWWMVSHTHTHILKSIRWWLAEEFVKVQHVQIGENEHDVQNGRLSVRLRQLLHEALLYVLVWYTVCAHKCLCMSAKGPWGLRFKPFSHIPIQDPYEAYAFTTTVACAWFGEFSSMF